jgi:transcriptional regulator with XRE-family HTH domain
MSKGPSIPGEVANDQEPLLALVGARIRATRQRAKLKQSDVARSIGTKQSYIVGVEAGEQNITLKTLARVAAALGVSPVSLLLEAELDTPIETAAAQLSRLLAEAMQDNERVAHFLRQAHAMVADGTGRVE